MARWPAALFILLCGLRADYPGLEQRLSVGLLGALAQEDAEQPADDAAQGAPKPEEVPSEAAEPGAPEQEDAPKAQDATPEVPDKATDEGEAMGAGGAAAFVDSARELQDKLNLLKELLGKKSNADPELKERLDKLANQLSSLGLDQLSQLSEGNSRNKASGEQKIVSGCLTMAVKRAGVRRPTTIDALRRLAQGTITPQEASQLELVRMVAVCITGLSMDEFEQFTAGKLDSLPKTLADKAALPAGKSEVLTLESELPGIWTQLAAVAGPLYDAMKEASGKEKAARPPIASSYGLLAAIPVLLAFGFIGKKFLDLQREQQQKEELRKEKAAKKKEK